MGEAYKYFRLVQLHISTGSCPDILFWLRSLHDIGHLELHDLLCSKCVDEDEANLAHHILDPEADRRNKICHTVMHPTF